MDYYPTKTYSGTPYLSNEQREFFIKQRDSMLAEMPELAYFEDIHRYGGIWERLNWNAFRKHDNHQIGSHPIHVAFLMLAEYRRNYEKRMFELEIAKAVDTISPALYEVLKFDLDMNKDYVESQFCVKAKQHFLKKYEGIRDTQGFVERLGATINARLNALASGKDPCADEVAIACQ
jgi:hypothetical protein